MRHLPPMSEEGELSLLDDILVGKSQKERGNPYRNMYSDIGAKKKYKDGDYSKLNGMAFLVFVAPTLFFSLVYGLKYISLPHFWVMVWVHEAGHGFWGLFGSRPFGALMGLGNELLFLLVPALFCFKEKKLYYAGCALLLFASLSIVFAGGYMQSASFPNGTSFAGALTGRMNDMNSGSHDWAIVFGSLGVIDHSFWIGHYVKAVGTTFTFIFLFACVIGLMPAVSGVVPKSLISILSPGAFAAFIYFSFVFGGHVEVLISFVFSIPTLKRLHSFVISNS